MVSEEELVSRRQAVAVARESLAQAQAEHDLLMAGSWSRTKFTLGPKSRKPARWSSKPESISQLEVRAPIDGEILKVEVHRGEYVGTPPGQTLVVIGDLSQMYVRVTIDEQDLTRFRPGRGGKGYVRGDADTPLDLAFVRVEPYVRAKMSLTGDAAEKVDTRVLEVLYALPAKTSGYFVGQQLDVFLDTDASLKDASQARSLTLN